MSDTVRKDPSEEKTVVVKKSDIEQQLHKADEEKTVLDTVNEGYKSLFDPSLRRYCARQRAMSSTRRQTTASPSIPTSRSTTRNMMTATAPMQDA